MAKKRIKQKKAGVIGKYPTGGNVYPAGITPELLAQTKAYISQQQGSMDGALPPDGTFSTTSTPPTIKSTLTDSAGMWSLLGGMETGLANTPGAQPDVTQGITGGALSGVGAGLQMGGPLGGLIGGLAGGALGFMESGQKLEDYNNIQLNKDKQRAKDRTVNPFQGFQFAEGGTVGTDGGTPGKNSSSKAKKTIVFAENNNNNEAFVTEGNNVKEFYKKNNPKMNVEVVPIYNDSELFKEKVKSLGKNDNILIFGHKGTKLLGMANKDIASYLKDSPAENLYLGSCDFGNMIGSYKDSGKKVRYRNDESWFGFNPKAKTLEDGMFGRNINYDAKHFDPIAQEWVYDVDQSDQGLQDAKSNTITKAKEGENYEMLDFAGKDKRDYGSKVEPLPSKTSRLKDTNTKTSYNEAMNPELFHDKTLTDDQDGFSAIGSLFNSAKDTIFKTKTPQKEEKGGYIDKVTKRNGIADPFLNIMYAEDGGDPTTDGAQAEDLVPVQTELKEMLLLNTGVLTQTKARLPHTKMDADEVTDILPAGSFIFSNSLDNQLELTDEIKDNIIGYGTAYYSEDGQEGDVESVEFESILPNAKKATFAEIAKNIKDIYSTKPDFKDVFSNVTNAENMVARIPFLQKLISLQNDVMGEDNMPSTGMQAYGKGGKVKKIQKMADGGYPSLEELMAKYNDFLNLTKDNTEQANNDRIQGDTNLEAQLRANNTLANGVVGPMGYLLQNPYVKPAYTDTNLSAAMFRPSSNQALQGIANQGIDQNNSLARQLLAQGMNPADAISMTAQDRARATSQGNQLNYNALVANDQLERDKYKFLSAARMSNDAVDVAAYNTTTDNQNKTIAGLASSGQTLIKGDSTIDNASNDWRTQRAKDYYENLTKIGQSDVDMSAKMAEIGMQQKGYDDQLKQLQAYLDAWKKQAMGHANSSTSNSSVSSPIDNNGNVISTPNNLPTVNSNLPGGELQLGKDLTMYSPAPIQNHIGMGLNIPGPIKGNGGWEYNIGSDGVLTAKNPKTGKLIKVDDTTEKGKKAKEAILNELRTKGLLNEYNQSRLPNLEVLPKLYPNLNK